MAGVEIVDVGGVGALQKRRQGKCCIRVLARHDGVLVSFASRVENGALAGPEGRTGEVKNPLPYLGRNFARKRTKN